MDLDNLKKEIKERINFYESSYEMKIWSLLDSDFHDFLIINYVHFFQDKDYNIFRKCMLNYFDCLINEAMCDNRVTINKEFVFNNLYYLQYILNATEINKSVEEIKDDLRIIYQLTSKTLTKKN